MCGEGENGKLGLSRENKNVFVPTPVNIKVPIRSVACGGNHTIAVTSKNSLFFLFLVLASLLLSQLLILIVCFQWTEMFMVLAPT